MKKTIVKSVLAATMLFSAVLGNGGITNAAAVKPTATTKPAATPAPIMRDNLSKYGMEKEVDLPVTLKADGLIYTVEKVMIYDVNSKDAQSLIKRYDYWNLNEFGKAKYLVWTKIKITNNSNKTVQRYISDLNYKWRLNVTGDVDGSAWPLFSGLAKHSMNSTESLSYFIIKPGSSLTTYQPYAISVQPTEFNISLNYNNKSELINLANLSGK